MDALIISIDFQDDCFGTGELVEYLKGKMKIPIYYFDAQNFKESEDELIPEMKRTIDKGMEGLNQEEIGYPPIITVLNLFPRNKLDLRSMEEAGCQLNIFYSVHTQNTELKSDFSRQLKESPPFAILYREILISEGEKDISKMILKKMVQDIQIIIDFSNYVGNKYIIDVPLYEMKPQIDITDLRDYLIDNPNDYGNALFNQLSKHEYQTVPTPKVETEDELYDSIFQNMVTETDRRVVYFQPDEALDPVFRHEVLPSVFHLFYPLLKWSLQPDILEETFRKFTFLSVPQNFYVYAGSKFEELIQSSYSKYNLPIPEKYFNWDKWNVSAEYTDAAEIITDAINENTIVETFFDESIGILWLITFEPIVTHPTPLFMRNNYNSAITGITDFAENCVDESSEQAQPSFPNDKDVKITVEKLREIIKARNRFEDDFVYSIPNTLLPKNQLCSPYYLPNGLHVNIIRALQNDKQLFKYNVSYKDLIQLSGDKDALIIQPIESIKILTTNPYGVAIIFNEQSLHYDGNSLILKSSNENQMIITNKGEFLLTHKGSIPMIVHPDGTISQNRNGVWTSIDKDSRVIENGKPMTKRCSKIKDLTSEADIMIRPDGVEYLVFPNGNRRLLVNLEFTIEQMADEITFDIPTFPVISLKSGVFKVVIDRFEFSIEGMNVDFNCKDYQIHLHKNHCDLTSEYTQMNLTSTECRFKSLGAELYANLDGEEKFDLPDPLPKKPVKKVKEDPNQLFEANSKFPFSRFLVDSYEVQFDNSIYDDEPKNSYYKMHSKYSTKFYAIRNNFSAVEFMRRDNTRLKNTIKQHSRIPYPSGGSISIMTTHFIDLDKIPGIFIEYESVPFEKRLEILSQIYELEIPENDIMELVDSAYQSYLSDTELFTKTLEAYLEKAHDKFIDDCTPIQYEDRQISIPPSTPVPRILKMQWDLYEPAVKDLPEGYLLNYWNCHESEFSSPEVPKT